MSRLSSENLTLAYFDRTVVENLSSQIPDGRITALVGANGSGKSTLLKGLARILKPRSGAVYLDGKAIHEQDTREVARQLAILPQGPEAPEGLTVRELVAYGRFPYQRALSGPSLEDRENVEKALIRTELAALAERPLGSLSGGERQRAWIAMALAQGTSILLLDEPTTFLDMGHQLEVLQLLRRLNREEGRTVVMALHDLNHAARTAHHLIALVRGAVFAAGPPHAVMTSEMIKNVFGVEADIIPDPRSGAPLCLPYAGQASKAEGGDSTPMNS